MGGEEVDEPIEPAVEVGMVVLIEDLSAREQQLMKPTVIAHRLLRTHTHPACSGRTPAARPPPTRNRWGSPVPGRAPDAEPPERHRPPSPTAGFGRPRLNQRGAQGHLLVLTEFWRSRGELGRRGGSSGRLSLSLSLSFSGRPGKINRRLADSFSSLRP